MGAQVTDQRWTECVGMDGRLGFATRGPEHCPSQSPGPGVKEKQFGSGHFMGAGGGCGRRGAATHISAGAITEAISPITRASA